MNKDIFNTIKDIATEVTADNNVELFDLEYVKEGPNYYLRVFIDKEDGVDILDCEKVSRQFDLIMEEKDLIKNAYILEVSSPGIDRPLKNDDDYKKYTGEIIDIKLYAAINGTKEYQGELLGFDNEFVKIECDSDIISIQKTNIATAKLAVLF